MVSQRCNHNPEGAEAHLRAWLLTGGTMYTRDLACAHTLLSHEPVVEGLVRLECYADGWTLWIRHRHYGGLFGDCPASEYAQMTLEEVCDVLEVSCMQWGPFGGPDRPAWTTRTASAGAE